MENQSQRATVHKSQRATVHKRERAMIHESRRATVQKSQRAMVHKSRRATVHESQGYAVHRGEEDSNWQVRTCVISMFKVKVDSNVFVPISNMFRFLHPFGKHRLV